MAISNFIPTIWSENLLRSLDKSYIAVAHCNREYEGEIKNFGSTVKICGVGKVNILDYTKNTDMSEPQALSDTVKELKIDQARYFNFQIDDVDRAQATPKLMDAAMKVAAEGLADYADKYVFSLCKNPPQSMNKEILTPEDVLTAIFNAREKLLENGVTDPSQIVLEVSPTIASLIMKAKINTCHDASEVMENGSIGNVAGCRVYVSKNVPIDGAAHQCIMRTRRAVAFAEQLSEIEAYRPEKRFADAVKGLHLYGATIVYPNEYLMLELLLSL